MNDASVPVARTSMSLSEETLDMLNRFVEEHGYASRSQALAHIMKAYIVEFKRQNASEVLVGTIMLFYWNSLPRLQKKLAELQHEYIDEVVSSLHVHLSNNRTLEVILVQGPARKLQAIADEMATMDGMIFSRLSVVTSLIPHLHPLDQLDPASREEPR